MPELMAVAMWHCASAEEWERVVRSKSRKDVFHTVRYGPSPGGPYSHDYTCTCEAFSFRGTCYHIEEVKGERCGWLQFMDGGDQAINSETGERCCPDCGGPIRAQNWGV